MKNGYFMFDIVLVKSKFHLLFFFSVVLSRELVLATCFWYTAICSSFLHSDIFSAEIKKDQAYWDHHFSREKNRIYQTKLIKRRDVLMKAYQPHNKNNLPDYHQDQCQNIPHTSPLRYPLLYHLVDRVQRILSVKYHQKVK